MSIKKDKFKLLMILNNSRFFSLFFYNTLANKTGNNLWITLKKKVRLSEN